MDPDFERVMNSLQPNQVSEPFQTQFGWHIVQVLERREYSDSAGALRNRAREAIRQRKTEEEYQAWMRRLRDEAYVEYRMPGVAVTAAEKPQAPDDGSDAPAAPSSAPSSAPAPTTTEPDGEAGASDVAAEAAGGDAPESGDSEFRTTTEDTGEDSPFQVGDPTLQP
jgi:hypothetical protein